MNYLLDTNICIVYLKNDAELNARLRAVNPADLKLCSVVKAELVYGARHSRHVEENLRSLAAFFSYFESLTFDDNAADWYGVIRAQLRQEGRPIGPNDLLIAAIARSHDMTLVTRNEAEFRRVAGLRMERW
jgi:tRNA(fMet)-specific endonuclease VapC